MDLGLTVSANVWQQVLDNAKLMDVEEAEDESARYLYSVRTSTKTLTIWNSQGWRDGQFLARVSPFSGVKKLKLEIELGVGGTLEDLKDHLKQLITRASVG